MTIVSFKHKFIFIKSGKVGGTVQLALFPHLGNEILLLAYPLRRIFILVTFNTKKLLLKVHVLKNFTALGPDIYNTFFVFTIERNFVDKVISFYAMEKYRELQRNNCNLEFNEFINRKNFPQDLNKYSICAGNALLPAVDKCYTYNNLWLLENDFKKLFHIDLNLKRFNSKRQYRRNQIFVEPVISNRQKNIVREYYNINKTFLKTFWLGSL